MARSQDISLQKLKIETRISYAQYCFEPNTNMSGKKQYQATFLIPKTADKSALDTLVLATLVEEFGGRMGGQAGIIDAIKNGVIKSPFLDGDGKQGRDKDGKPKPGYAGHWFIRATSGEDYPPKMMRSERGAIVPASKAEIKSGDYGFPVVGVYTWDDQRNGKGASFGFSMFLKSRSGESLGQAGGSGSPDDYFEPIPDEGAAPAETKTGQGAAGLFG